MVVRIATTIALALGVSSSRSTGCRFFCPKIEYSALVQLLRGTYRILIDVCYVFVVQLTFIFEVYGICGSSLPQTRVGFASHGQSGKYSIVRRVHGEFEQERGDCIR